MNRIQPIFLFYSQIDKQRTKILNAVSKMVFFACQQSDRAAFL